MHFAMMRKRHFIQEGRSLYLFDSGVPVRISTLPLSRSIISLDSEVLDLCAYSPRSYSLQVVLMSHVLNSEPTILLLSLTLPVDSQSLFDDTSPARAVTWLTRTMSSSCEWLYWSVLLVMLINQCI